MPLPLHARLTLRSTAVFSLLFGFLLGPPLRAQSSASWAVGAGNWSTGTNWDCQCVPSGNVIVYLNNGNVTLDMSVSVNSLLGSGTLNMSGTSLTASQTGLGVSIGTLQMDNGASMSAPGVLVGTLVMTDSSISAPVSVTSSASLSNSQLDSLGLEGQLNASNSIINGGSGLGTTSLVLTQQSSITQSTVTGGLNIELGGTLAVDQNSVMNFPVDSSGLTIGFGSMTVQGGSQLNLNFGLLTMSSPQGASSLMLDGAGTALNLSDNGIDLMGFGNATLTVQNHASINSQGDTEMLVGSPIPGLGFGGTSDVVVKGGGTVSVGTVRVTGTFGIPSELDVSDSGSQVTITNGLEVSGGTVIIEKQATLSADLIGIGSLDAQDEGAVIVDTGGKLTLDGSSSSQNLAVGSTGRGTLTIQNGGSGSGIQSLVIGDQPGSFGTMTITGAGNGGVGSSWENAGTLYVGYAGTGTLNVNNLGELKTVGVPTGGGNLSAVIAALEGSTGTATVNGGTWTLGGLLQVGASGTGTLTIATDLGGATSDSSLVQSLDTVIGVADGATGTVTVSGDRAKWDNAGNLTVGSSGKGSLTISNRGQVNDVNAVIAAEQPSTAPPFGAASSVTVTGDGSQWNNSGTLTVGINGNAGLTVSNGGRVTDTDGTIGSGISGESSVTVTGLDSLWQNSGQLLVGVGGKGTLTVTDQGEVVAGSAVIGSGGFEGSIDAATGGKLNVNGALSVGDVGTGTVTVENGGQVQSGNGQIGASAGQGTVNVVGPGSSWQVGGGAGTVAVGSSSAVGTLYVQQGGEVAAGQVVVNPTGTLNAQGGLITGDVVNNGGMVTPGDATGTMSITGNYIQHSGTLLMEIDGVGAGEFDQLDVSGLAEFDGGIIGIVFGNGFQPTDGESFDLILATLGLTDRGVSVDVQGLADGLQFAYAFGPNGFGISFESAVTPPPPPTQTPEPPTMFLLVSGLAAVLGPRLKSPRKNFLT
jgi:T5SS/PEP-CTERM-associated repeat protein